MREKALYRTVPDIRDVRTRRDGRDDANMPPSLKRPGITIKIFIWENGESSGSVGRAFNLGSKGC